MNRCFHRKGFTLFSVVFAFNFFVAVLMPGHVYSQELTAPLDDDRLAQLKQGGELLCTTSLGRQLFSLKNPADKLVDDYLDARQAWQDNPGDADLTIWFGRRAGYLMRLNESIEIFTLGILNHPEDARFLRHRGHRYISLRQFDKAIQDLEKAATLVEGNADQVEPDGVPNQQGIPLTTLHGNIWYHLGLAYYLKGDLTNALRCYEQRIPLEKYDDNAVANNHWRYMILRRLDRDAEAKKVVEEVRPDMSIIENDSYHKMCLFYSGQLEREKLANVEAGSSSSDVVLYGLANWFLYDQKQPEECRTRLEKLLSDGTPFSFAFIAAEADYSRLFSK